MAYPSNESIETLRSEVLRIENLEAEKDAISEDVKSIYADLKAGGYDTKMVRRAVRIRKMDPAERIEQEALLETYLKAIGGEE